MKKPVYIVTSLLIINFLLRIMIYYKTTLFHFSDFSSYLDAIERIAHGEKLYLLIGNSLFAISYLGYLAKYILGSLDFFFIFNCLLGTLTSLVLYILVIQLTKSIRAGIITITLHTLYTEFMVFSSVFYTPVLMVFLVSCFILGIYFYMKSDKMKQFITLLFLGLLYSVTFFFKPELKYLPYFLLLTAILLSKNKIHSALRKFPHNLKAHQPVFSSDSKKIFLLSICLFTFYFFLDTSHLISSPPGNILANDFIFFGHTDYGGDGGEGALIYPENKARYNEAWQEYLVKNNIANPGVENRNNFQRGEIKNFVLHHPGKWLKLQFTKFFRTFGVVPEGYSFKILYSGLLKNRLWLTSFVIVAPIALIIIAFLIFCDLRALRNLAGSAQNLFYPAPFVRRPAPSDSGFLIFYLSLFVYYIIATTFFGHYQERYRIPVMVLFIIPALSYFIAVAFTALTEDARSDHDASRILHLSPGTVMLKGAMVLIFLIIWVLQAKDAFDKKERLNNAIKMIQK